MQTIKATNNTIVKRSTEQSTSLPNNEKFSLNKGDSLQVNWIRDAYYHHAEVELAEPRNGFFNWFIFKPHFSFEPKSISSEGIELLESFEGFEKDNGDGTVSSYWDALGRVWTIGVGLTGVGIGANTRWTREKHDLEAKKRLAQFCDSVLKTLSPSNISQNELDSCISLAYNIGSGGFNNSTVARLHKRGDKIGAANAFLMWNRSGANKDRIPGLSRRRCAERALYLGEDWRVFTRENWKEVERIYNQANLRYN